MLALFSAILMASLLGSAHCVGMCGAFVAFAVTPAPNQSTTFPTRTALNTAYNAGRLITYSLLGSIAGGLGAALDLGGSLIGVQRFAAIGAAIIMIICGVGAALRSFGVQVPRFPVPPALVRLARAGHAWAFDLSPLVRAAAVGLLTTLLPCGWLYAFVVIAAGTGSWAYGTAAMAAFWLGTLPALAAIGIGARVLAGPFSRIFPLLTSIVLIAAGLWTVQARLSMPPIAPHPASQGTGIAASLQAVENADKACPLCTNEDQLP